MSFFCYGKYVSEEPNRTKGEGWSTASKLFEAYLPSPTPRIVFTGRPKAALLYSLFGGFRCCAWLFFVIVV